MKAANLRTMEIEVIPAILVKNRDALLESIKKVRPYVKTIHIDVMDNKFVPNFTVGIDGLRDLPESMCYEFHWMVKEPEKWMREIKGSHIHLVHVETLTQSNWEEIKHFAEEQSAMVGLALNPETPIEALFPYIKDIKRILVMSVHPGFSGQKYIKDVESKITYLREHFPSLDIEIDGGINPETAANAIKAGANKIVAASAIFTASNVAEAIEKLRKVGSYAH